MVINSDSFILAGYSNPPQNALPGAAFLSTNGMSPSLPTPGYGVDRWSIFPTAYDPSNISTTFQSRLHYMHSIPYSNYSIPPHLSSCSVYPLVPQNFTDSIVTNPSSSAQTQYEAGQSSPVNLHMRSRVDSTVDECKRLNSLNHLRLKAKDHSTTGNHSPQY